MRSVYLIQRNLARNLIAGIVLIAGAVLISGCGDDSTAPTENQDNDLRARFDLQTLPPIPYPPDNPPRQERISLGRLLFFDPIISGEMDVSCGTCHHPNFAFADRRQFGAGVSGVGLGPDRILSVSARTGEVVENEPRNTPTVFNTAYNLDETGDLSHTGFQFWDGRVKGLEAQASKPITSRVEMRGDAYPGDDATAAAAALDSVIARLRAIPEYETRFRMAFPQEALEVDNGSRLHVIDSSTYVRAVAAYERELVTNNSAFDRFVLGDDDALTDQQKHGLELFFTKAKCGNCHHGPMLSDFKFAVVGVPQEGTGKGIIPGDDVGREEFTLDQADRFAFRTPTIRNVELTPPYMHDGVLESLEEVMEFYNAGAQPRHPSITYEMMHPDVRDPLGLTREEMDAIVAFMKSTTDNGSALPGHLLEVPATVPSGLPPVFGMKDASIQAISASTGKHLRSETEF